MAEISLVSGALSLTGQCTIACKHCYSESSPKIKAFLSTDLLKSIISTLQRHGVRQIFLGGGEPFLHKGLEEVVAHMFKNGVLPSISTNGHVIATKRLELLYEAGMRYNLSISLDGPNEEINSTIRGTNSFAKTLFGMYQLSEFGKILWGVNYVCCKNNFGHALDTAKLASRLGASYFNCIKFTPSGRGERFAKKMAITDDEYRIEISTLSESFTPFGEYYQDIYVFDVRSDSVSSDNKSMAKCARSYFSDFQIENPLGVSINHFGTVALAPPNIYLGNLMDTPLDEIISRLAATDVLEKYDQWLYGYRDGIHPPRGPLRNMPEVIIK
ncbi:radical SAM protein [Citrobacter arsenatis]|uniref:Radical SAM protein n=1 Tax=Citrobacter arsenatis TaxID=2546350 RepID=A0A4P6WLT7_9ENTR|nr:radical SAM protein [Citrobacter arsenatis]QBM22986.1 radical SAM protein [Citrobacter arsenatis]